MRLPSIAIFSLALLCSCAAKPPFKTDSTPADSGQISIFGGEQIYLQAIFQGNKFVGIKKVDTVSDPSVTLTFRFLQGNGGKNMLLSVTNPLSHSVKYHLDMVDFSGILHKTSSCPVMAGRSVGEYWPHSIPEIRISNFHLATTEEEKICIY